MKKVFKFLIAGALALSGCGSMSNDQLLKNRVAGQQGQTTTTFFETPEEIQAGFDKLNDDIVNGRIPPASFPRVFKPGGPPGPPGPTEPEQEPDTSPIQTGVSLPPLGESCDRNLDGVLICPTTEPSTPSTSLYQPSTSTASSTSTSTTTKPTTTSTSTSTSTSSPTTSTTSSTVPVVRAVVWAGGTLADAISVAGAGHKVTGLVHSNGGFTVAGAGSQFVGGVEYATTLLNTSAGSTFSPAAVKKPVGAAVLVNLAPYQPGGTATTGTYKAVPVSSCINGVYTVAASALATGVVYVPCSITITGAGISKATTIVAAGNVTISGAQITLTANTNLPSIVATGNVTVSGAGSAIANEVRSGATFTSSGAANKFACIAATKIALQGSAATITGTCTVTP
jgi:hypothetical protein